MRVLADLHHGDLFRSLRLLFESRLGGQVFRPYGLDWFDEGWWSYPFHARDTAAQFLGTAYDHPGVTLDNFLDPHPHERAFDLMLSSTPEQWYAWEAKRREHGITIPHIFQSGNDWVIPPDCRNLLNSTTLQAPPGCHAVYYHQEFSLKDYYRPGEAEKPGRVISSFMHYNPRSDFFYALEREMPDWIFREYGAGGRDGQPADLPWAMRATRYLFHAKQTEGWGYNVHQAAACGVPIFMRAAANKHQACGALLTGPDRGVASTFLDLDDYTSPGHLADAIRRFDKDWEAHSRAIAGRFHEAVNFDAEAVRIKEWLTNLR